MNVQRVLLLLLLLGFVAPVAAFAQADVSPTDFYQSPGEPSCGTLTVYGGESIYVIVQFSGPSGDFQLDGQLDSNGQTMICPGGWDVGQYAVTAVAYWGFYWVGAYAPFTVHPYVPPYPIVNSAAVGGSGWNIVSATGSNFNPDVRVVVAGWDWAYGQWYVGPAYGWGPVVYPSPDGHSFSLEVTESNLLAIVRSGNGYLHALDPEGNTNGWVPITAPPAPVVTAAGTAGADWDWIWATGSNFAPDSKVVVAGWDWAYGQWYVGPWFGWSPALNVSPDGHSLSLQVASSDLRALMGFDGVYILVVDPAGNNSGWIYVNPSPRPTVTSITPSCADKYCMTITGLFPASAVPFFATSTQWGFPDAYSDLVVSPTQMTFRLNPSIRHVYDTEGLWVLIVNQTLPNWTNGDYAPPVDRAVIGSVEGVGGGGQQFYLSGWACAKTQPTSIDVHVYVGGPAGGGGTFAFSGNANQGSEPGVGAACDYPSGSNYRFYLPIPHWVTQNYGGQPFYVYGISPIGLANNLIGNGNVTVPGGVDRSIIGLVQSITAEGTNFFLNGWACAKTFPGAVLVRAYLGSDNENGPIAFSGSAGLSTSDPDVANCIAPDSLHRFKMQIPSSVVQQSSGQRIYVRGVSPYGLANNVLGGGPFFVPGLVPTSMKEFIYLGDRLIAVESQ